MTPLPPPWNPRLRPCFPSRYASARSVLVGSRLNLPLLLGMILCHYASPKEASRPKEHPPKNSRDIRASSRFNLDVIKPEMTGLTLTTFGPGH